MTIFIVYLINGVIFGLITSHVASSKGYEGGFAWGFWLGLIGLLVVGFRPNIEQTVQEYRPMYANTNHSAEVKKPTAGWVCSCGAKNQESLQYCLNCRISRKDVKPIVKVNCPHCGASNNDSNTYCFACNKEIKSEIIKEKAVESKSAELSSIEAAELLEKLAALHEQSILTDEEFQQKKANIMAKI